VSKLLNDPVEKYIQLFEGTRVYEDGELVAQEKPFTVRHLLTHTAGFTYGTGDSYVDSLYRTHSPDTWDIENLKKAIEVLSGMPFDVFLEERLFGHMGMDDTGFEVPEDDFDRLAMIYTPDDSTGTLKAVPEMTNGVKKKVTLFSGGGGLVSTLDDYAKFGQMLLNGGTLNGVRILEGSTVDIIMSDQMPEDVEYFGGSIHRFRGRSV